MSGRHEQSGAMRGLRWLIGALGLGLVASILLAMAPADASTQTVGAQLSLSGIATSDNPTGGSVLGIHPGDKVTFKASAVPTAGLQKLGLGGLVDGVLGTLVTYQVSGDFSGLPGGAKDTVLKGSASKTFTFSKKGTYNFTWTAQNVTLLGALPIDLDGNQLKGAGIKLNASNEYVGKIVVATDPPKGGISVQLPSVKVAPSLPVVGQLPTLTLPGVSVPTVHVSVPDLAPSSSPATKSSSAPKSSTPDTGFTPPALSIPQLVVPKGDTGAVYGSGGGGGLGALTDTTQGVDGGTAVTSGSSAVALAPVPAISTQNSSGKDKTVDLAASTGSPSGQLPVILAIVAIIALALVAGTYARLYLLKRSS